MALTKQDINQIGGLLDKQTKALDKKLNQQTKAFEKRFDTIEKRMATKDDIRALGQQISRGFADQAELMKNTYASKEEVEELRNEVDELREKVEALERQQHLSA